MHRRIIRLQGGRLCGLDSEVNNTPTEFCSNLELQVKRSDSLYGTDGLRLVGHQEVGIKLQFQAASHLSGGGEVWQVALRGVQLIRRTLNECVEGNSEAVNGRTRLCRHIIRRIVEPDSNLGRTYSWVLRRWPL